MKVQREFYDRPTLDVTRDLIGKVLVHNRLGVRTSGVIVEAEAYIGESDPACHAAPGPTPRNRLMYGPPGHVYVYLNYGIHFMVNIVTEEVGRPAAVLIRALDPREGTRVMRERRARVMKGRPLRSDRTWSDHELCRGPGNLTMAMGITLAENGCDLLGDQLFLEDDGDPPHRIIWGPRIGISVGTDRRWRVHSAGNPAVSATRHTIAGLQDGRMAGRKG